MVYVKEYFKALPIVLVYCFGFFLIGYYSFMGPRNIMQNIAKTGSSNIFDLVLLVLIGILVLVFAVYLTIKKGIRDLNNS